MEREFDIYFDEANKAVTLYYLGIISEALEKKGYRTNFIKTPLAQNHNHYGAVVINYGDVAKARKLGYKVVVFWLQGITPEEMFLSSKNFFAFIVRSFRERKGIKGANFVFYCSDYMKHYCEKKYFLKGKKSYVMPCFNEEINEDVILHKDYSRNEFVYAGSLSKWQCFEKIAFTYKQIEQKRADTLFSVFTKDEKEAKEILNRLGVKRYQIAFVGAEELAIKIQTAKFGFCIRDNIAVNKVATPTKLSNYVSNGIMPIYSRCLDSFHSRSKSSDYVFCVDENDFMEKVLRACGRSSFNGAIAKDYSRVYGDYYSKAYHVPKIVDFFDFS